MRFTGKAGADHVIEVGGTDTFAKSLSAVAVGGTVSVIGGVSGFDSAAPLREILAKMSVIRGNFVGSHAMFEAMNRTITRAQTKPVIDRVFPFADAPVAYQHQISGAHFRQSHQQPRVMSAVRIEVWKLRLPVLEDEPGQGMS